MAKRREFYGIPAASREWAFTIAATNGNIKAMKSLLADGVNINARPDGATALHEAAQHGTSGCVELLIAERADLNLLDQDKLTPLMRACLAGKAKGSQVALMLLQAGADATLVRKSDQMTALKFAVKRCTPEVLQALIDAGADVDGPRGTDQTALMLAARDNNVESLKVLIENGADVSLPCKLPWAEGRTAEGLAELEKQRAALAYLRSLHGGEQASSKPKATPRPARGQGSARGQANRDVSRAGRVAQGSKKAGATGRRAENAATVQASWQRIETWLAEHALGVARSLAKAASPAQVQKVEGQLGISLPAEYKESCAIHDGQKDDCDLIPDGFGTFYLLRLKDISKEWRLWNDLSESGEFQDRSASGDRGVASAWWKSAWIPFASNGGGDHLCLDLAPGRGGKVGQVIKVEHDNGDRTLLAPSFSVWLHKLADSLESGELDGFLE